MKIQAGNRVYWIDPHTNRRHKCEVTRAYKTKAKILTDDLRSLSVAIEELELVPLPWKTIKEKEEESVVEVEAVPVGEVPRREEMLSVTFKKPPKTAEQTYRQLPEWMKGTEAHLYYADDGSIGLVFGTGAPPNPVYPELYGDRPDGSSIVEELPDGTIEPTFGESGSIVEDDHHGTIEPSDRPDGSSIVGDVHHGTIEPSDRPDGSSIVGDGHRGTIEPTLDGASSIVGEVPDGESSIGLEGVKETIERLSIGELFHLQIFIAKLIPMKRRIGREPPRGSVNQYERKESNYWRFTYSIDGKTKHKHITGGCVGSPPSDERAARVKEMIAAGKPVEAIVHWLETAKTE